MAMTARNYSVDYGRYLDLDQEPRIGETGQPTMVEAGSVSPKTIFNLAPPYLSQASTSRV